MRDSAVTLKPPHVQTAAPPPQATAEESLMIDALQQAILATISNGSGSGVPPNLFSALQALGAEQLPAGFENGTASAAALELHGADCMPIERINRCAGIPFHA